MRKIGKALSFAVCCALLLFCSGAGASARANAAESGCRIAVADSLSGDEDAKKMRLQIGEDIAELAKRNLPAAGQVNVRIVEGKTSFDESGELQCSIADFESRAYRPFLVEAYCGVREPWIGYGISGYVFGEETDAGFLKTWYQNPENMGTLRLFGLRFWPDWVTEEEGKAARQTAVSLAAMLTEGGSFDWIYEPVTDLARQEWLDSIGADAVYEDEYAGYLDGYRFDTGEGYLIRISDDQNVYTFYDVLQDVQTAEEAETFLYRERFWKERIYKTLQEEGGAAFDGAILGKDNIPRIEYVLKDDVGSRSMTYGSRDKIVLNRSAFGHLGYWINCILKPKGTHWNQGALVMYFNMVFAEDDYVGDAVKDFARTGAFFSDPAAEDRAADEAVFEYMETLLAQGNRSLNRAFVDACSAAQLFDGLELNASFDTAYREMDSNEGKKVWPGDELTRAQAVSFFAWLTDRYTMEKTLQLCAAKEPDYQMIFGTSCEELKNGWMEWLSSAVEA